MEQRHIWRGQCRRNSHASEGDTIQLEWTESYHNVYRSDNACTTLSDLNSLGVQYAVYTNGQSTYDITPDSPGTYCFGCTYHYSSMHFTLKYGARRSLRDVSVAPRQSALNASRSNEQRRALGLSGLEWFGNANHPYPHPNTLTYLAGLGYSEIGNGRCGVYGNWGGTGSDFAPPNTYYPGAGTRTTGENGNVVWTQWEGQTHTIESCARRCEAVTDCNMMTYGGPARWGTGDRECWLGQFTGRLPKLHL